MRTEGDPDSKQSYWMWCPACDDSVRINDGWAWNGNLAKPTFTPSILITGGQWEPGHKFYKPSHHKVATGEKTICHSYLVDGVWQFLGDCTHDLAGQHVPMVPVPDWLATS